MGREKLWCTLRPGEKSHHAARRRHRDGARARARVPARHHALTRPASSRGQTHLFSLHLVLPPYLVFAYGKAPRRRQGMYRRALSIAPAALAALLSRATVCEAAASAPPSLEGGGPLAPPRPSTPPRVQLPSHAPVPHERLTRLLSIAVMPIRALLGTTVSPGEPFPRDSPHVTLVLPPEGNALIAVRTKLVGEAALASFEGTLTSVYGPAADGSWTAPGSGALVSLRSDESGIVVEWQLSSASATRGFSLADAYAVISIFASAAFGVSNSSPAVALASSTILSSVAELYAQLPSTTQESGGSSAGSMATFGDPSLRRYRPRPAAYQQRPSLSTSPDASADRPNPKTQPLEFLASLGIECKSAGTRSGAALNWDDLAGASDVQARVEESILFPLDNPKIYEAVCALTRARAEENKHGVFLISGPPGVGKTTVARIVAAHVERPLVVLTFASIGSAYYAQSESNLQGVLDAVTAIPGAILFVDEADALFPARSASRGSAPLSSGAAVNSKLLATMLTFLEGISGAAETSVILATNRPEILDAALLSRCAATLELEPPDASARAAIWARYAKSLSEAERASLSSQTVGFTGRDIKHVAEVAERRHVAALLRAGKVDAADGVTAPSFDFYAAASRERAQSVLASAEASASKMGGSVFDKWRQQAEAQKQANAEGAGAHESPHNVPGAAWLHP